MPPLEKITSRDNRRLAAVRKVRDGIARTEIFIEGRRLVREAISAELEITAGFVSDQFEDRDLVVQLAQRTPTFELPSGLFGTIADTESTQGIVVLARRPDSAGDLSNLKFSENSSRLPMVVFLKEINNPSNLGAVIRTAEAAGVAGLIISSRSADPYSPKGLRSSMGSAFRLRLYENARLEVTLQWARRFGIRLVGTDPTAGTLHTHLDWTVPSLVVFGSEAHGLTAAELKLMDETVHIALASNVESLNLAVSAGVIMFEALRQNLP